MSSRPTARRPAQTGRGNQLVKAAALNALTAALAAELVD
jgi:hypothetical protein